MSSALISQGPNVKKLAKIKKKWAISRMLFCPKTSYLVPVQPNKAHSKTQVMMSLTKGQDQISPKWVKN